MGLALEIQALLNWIHLSQYLCLYLSLHTYVIYIIYLYVICVYLYFFLSDFKIRYLSSLEIFLKALGKMKHELCPPKNCNYASK